MMPQKIRSPFACEGSALKDKAMHTSCFDMSHHWQPNVCRDEAMCNNV